MNEKFHPEMPIASDIPVSDEEVAKIIESINSSPNIVQRAVDDSAGIDARNKLIVEKVNRDFEFMEEQLAAPSDVFSAISEAYHRRIQNPGDAGDPEL